MAYLLFSIVPTITCPFKLNVDPSLRRRLHDESEEGSWNPEIDSAISYQLLEQIGDSEENELDDDSDITESEDNFDLEGVQGAVAKSMGKDNAVFNWQRSSIS
jgi:hypothetical protein